MNRNLDDLGRLVIPKEMRKTLELDNGDEVRIELAENKIIITNPKLTNIDERIKRELERTNEFLEEAIDKNLTDVITLYKGYIKALEWVLEEDK